MKDRCPCGGIILADTEDWETPICHHCWVPLIGLDIPKLQKENARLREGLHLYARGCACGKLTGDVARDALEGK